MNYTTQTGLLTELQCQQDFSRCGILLSQPIINDSRYDFLADIDGKIYKIQCKTARPTNEKKDAISFSSSNINGNHSKKKDYRGQIDFFYTSYKEQGYLIPVEDAGVTHKTLRLVANRKMDKEKVSWAKDYEIENVLVSKLKYEIPQYSKSREKTIKRCLKCGKEITRQATYCTKCVDKKKVDCRANKKDLKEVLRNKSFLQVGRDYNVTDNAVRRWCAEYGLPTKRIDIDKMSDSEWDAL